ncbi:hypothetical protein [Pararhizobium sp.]|uniref:hypothetical protein n=1 Tax=Pararhizobium sp. TaxID=1977563 RepID=UPI003D0D3823
MGMGDPRTYKYMGPFRDLLDGLDLTKQQATRFYNACYSAVDQAIRAEAPPAGERADDDDVTTEHAILSILNSLIVDAEHCNDREGLDTAVSELAEIIRSRETRAAGWAFTYACIMQDKGVDIQTLPMPSMLDAAKKQILMYLQGEMDKRFG